MGCGKIGFDHLPVKCLIGHSSKERESEQTIFVDLRVERDFSQMQGDALSETLDYAQLAEVCRKVALEGHFRMLETLALHIAEALKTHFPKHKGHVRVKKPMKTSPASFYLVEWSWS